MMPGEALRLTENSVLGESLSRTCPFNEGKAKWQISASAAATSIIQPQSLNFPKTAQSRPFIAGSIASHGAIFINAQIEHQGGQTYSFNFSTLPFTPVEQLGSATGQLVGLSEDGLTALFRIKEGTLSSDDIKDTYLLIGAWPLEPDSLQTLITVQSDPPCFTGGTLIATPCR